MRLGDFYETFGEDARTVARELAIVLTSRRDDAGRLVPMAGVPFHSLDLGLTKLIARGYRVAVAEQVGRPAEEQQSEPSGVLTPDGSTVTDAVDVPVQLALPLPRDPARWP